MKVLLVGSSFSAAPIFHALRPEATHITVVGKKPDEPCHAFADASVFEDYSDREVLLDICQKGSFDAVVPSCNDYAYMAATYVADKLGYPGYDTMQTAEILHTKDAYRAKLKALSIASPVKYGEFTRSSWQGTLDAAVPLIVKPVDSFSGRGVEVVRDVEKLDNAVQKAFRFSKQKRMLIEQFVEGRLYSHTAFVADGSIFWHEFADEFCDAYPFAVDRSVFPSSLPYHITSEVHASVSRLVDDLAVNDGLMHTQFIANDSSFWIIECMRRCPGDLYGHQIELACGIDYARFYAIPYLGLSYDRDMTLPPAHWRVERRIVAASSAQPFFSVALTGEGSEIEFVPLKESGIELDRAPFDKAGVVFFRGRLGNGNAKDIKTVPQGYGQLDHLNWKQD